VDSEKLAERRSEKHHQMDVGRKMSHFSNNDVPYSDGLKYSEFNQGGNQEESVEPEQHFSRIAALTADSRMSH
jgi:hypothetical protein